MVETFRITKEAAPAPGSNRIDPPPVMKSLLTYGFAWSRRSNPRGRACVRKTKSNMTLDEIRELIQLVSDTGVAELEVQRGENRVRVRRSFPSETAVYAPAYGAPVGPVATTTPAAAPAAPGVPAKTESSAPKPDNLVHVKSPIVGTFYACASPGAPSFVGVGERVNVGKVLCIIESMKLMNEIEADVAGIIEAVLVQNGQPVEYGESLFAIRPV